MTQTLPKLSYMPFRLTHYTSMSSPTLAAELAPTCISVTLKACLCQAKGLTYYIAMPQLAARTRPVE